MAYDLTLEKVKIGYRDNLLIDETTLTIGRGETVTMIAPNGSGKTTLLRVLLGYQQPLQGRCLINGDPVTNLKGNERAKLIRYVPQQFKALPEITVDQFKEALCNIYKVQGDCIEQLLTKLSLSKNSNSKIKNLSGGEARRLFLAAALLIPAPVLLLDEPLSFLDSEGQATVVKILQQISIEHPETIIILTAHSNLPYIKTTRSLEIKDRQLIEVAL